MVYFDVLIIGAGHAGAQAAIMLRQQKYTGSIALVGEEPEFPYERPPLSKEYLSGKKTFERIRIRPPDFWQERQISLLREHRVEAVDAAAHQVTVTNNSNSTNGTNGETIGYGRMIWATGGVARRLAVAGAELPGVQTVRTKADVDRMKAALDTAKQIVVIGGGYIGLEAAAVLAKAGKKIVLLEALERILARVAGEDLSRFFERTHRAYGVDVRLGVAVEAIEGSKRAEQVRLSSGETIEANLVIVGIGIIPAVEPLIEAGAEPGDSLPGANKSAEPSHIMGVMVDENCRTSLPDIFAIGDCAAHVNSFADGAVIRLESVQNANDMANVAARTICGDPQPYRAIPWFWSNQYDFKLQTVGISTGHDASVVRGDPQTGSFSVIYLKQGRVIALDCVNAIKDYVQGRALILGRHSPARADLADTTLALKQLAV